MPGVNSILDIGRGALFINQWAINVTGHNIANVNTPGYSRQKMSMAAKEAMSHLPGQIGTGVRAMEIRRIHDRYLAAQICDEYQGLGRWEAEKGVLGRVEMVLSPDEFNDSMCEFWNAWEDLANNPSSQAERVVILARGEQLAYNIQRMHAGLEEIQRNEINAGIKVTVQDINVLTAQIADLNNKVARYEAGDQNANDFRDKRDLVLKELSTKINIDYFENDDGHFNVFISGGKPLVIGEVSYELSTQTNAGLEEIVWENSEGEKEVVTGAISGGILKGKLVDIQRYLSRLDTFAENLMEKVNDIHSAGYGLDGSTGNDFFTGTSASDIAVNQDIVDDTDRIAASGTAEGVPGDNSNAIAVANLRNESTIGDYYNSLVTDVGTELQKATINFDHQSEMVAHLDNYRESISGVSIDEEMVKLIQYQHAYDAAAKLIVVADEMLGTVINMI